MIIAKDQYVWKSVHAAFERSDNYCSVACEPNLDEGGRGTQGIKHGAQYVKENGCECRKRRSWNPQSHCPLFELTGNFQRRKLSVKFHVILKNALLYNILLFHLLNLTLRNHIFVCENFTNEFLNKNMNNIAICAMYSMRIFQ